MRTRNKNSLRSQLLEERAHAMRQFSTQSEQRLWAAIRGKRLGVAFRRQVVVGEFIVDFLAPAVYIVVEVDGGYHSSRAKADARRDRVLARLGYRVVRLTDELVMGDLAAALAAIKAVFRQAQDGRAKGHVTMTEKICRKTSGYHQRGRTVRTRWSSWR